MLDHCLLVLVKLLLRDVDRGDTDIRIGLRPLEKVFLKHFQ
jgi:hypothetical protein